MSTITAVADALASQLNAHFGALFNAERKLVPIFDLELVGSAIVAYVVPQSLDIQVADRGSHYFDCTLNVSLQQRLPQADSEGVAMYDLVESVIDHLRFQPLEMSPGHPALFLSIANDPTAVHEHAEKHGVFTSLITVVYRVKR